MNDAMRQAGERAVALVGQGYIYGAKGQICSPAFRAGQAAQYPEQAGTILGLGAKWDGKPVWDCAQLTREAARAAGVSLVSGATSQWNRTSWARKGTLSTLPPGETCFVYRRQKGSETVMAHTGVALGDGTCVHAKGTADGVIRQAVDEAAWTHWASPWAANGEEGKGMSANARVTAQSGSTVNVRQEPGGALKDRLALGTVAEILREASGWSYIRYEGGEGWMDSAFLERLAAPEDSVCLTLERAEALRLLEKLREATQDE